MITHEKGSYSIEPILKRLESIVIEAVDKSKSGLSVMGISARRINRTRQI